MQTLKIKKKNVQMNFVTKQKQIPRQKCIYGCQGEEWGRGKDGEFGVDMYTLQYLK